MPVMLERYATLDIALAVFQLHGLFRSQECTSASAAWMRCISIISSGAQPALHSVGGAIFMRFCSMTSSRLFNRGTNFSQTVTYNNNVFLPPDTKSIVYKHTFCTTLVNKNRTFYNGVGSRITSFKRNFWLHAICACTEQHFTCKMRWENWWLGLRVWCLG